MEDDFVTITEEKYQELLNSDLIVNSLYEAGVDNWVEYDFAMEIYREKLMRNMNESR